MNRKIFFSAAFVIALLAAYVVYSNFLKTAPSMKKLKAEYSLQAVDLYNAFDSDEVSANAQYQNKVIEVTGEVILITNEEGFNPIISLKTEGFGVIQCTTTAEMTEEELEEIQMNSTITIRGECIGMLLDVLIERSIII
jgi:hypothetical protein